MKNSLAIVIATVLAMTAFGGESDEVAGVYRCSSGIECRTITLLKNGAYLARWDGDIGTNGTSVGTWELTGKKVRLTPTRETGTLMPGHFRVLILGQFMGQRSLLRAEDEKYADNPFFQLTLQKSVPNQSAKPTPPKGG